MKLNFNDPQTRYLIDYANLKQGIIKYQSNFLSEKKLQELELSVWDPTDTGTQPRGKQTLRPRGIWYSAVSGIWQTVWLEAVEKTHIYQINFNSDIDHKKIKIDLGLKNPEGNEKFSIKISQAGAPIINQIFDSNQDLNIQIPNPKLWSPGL